MQLAGMDWVGGVAYPELGVVIVAAPATGEGLLELQQDIPHELTHKVLYDALGVQGYASLPTWVNEGLATYFETRPDPDRAVALQSAAESGSLLPLPDLCLPFPDDPHLAQLGYAQSQSIMTYVRASYGWSGIRELLRVYGDGLGCDSGVQRALGVDLRQLEHDWRVWVQQDSQDSASAAGSSISLLLHDVRAWLALLAVLLLPSLASAISGRT
jgi:hypothetical protein